MTTLWSGSLLRPLCRFWGLNSGCQACTASVLPAESCQWPFWFLYLFIQTITDNIQAVVSGLILDDSVLLCQYIFDSIYSSISF